MKKKAVKKDIIYLAELVLSTDPPTQHGKGKNCTKCGSRKDTKKVGNKFLCESCRDKNDE